MLWRIHVCLLGGGDYLHPTRWSIDFSSAKTVQTEIDRLTGKRQWVAGKIDALHGDLYCAARDYIVWIDERLNFLE